MIVGVTTEAIAGEGLILTAGGIDAHIHFICPQQVDEALASGVTTFIGGGTGPATGTNATTCTPGARHIELMLQATDALPINFGFTRQGQHVAARGPRRADPRRRDRPQAARGLGHDAGGDRLLPDASPSEYDVQVTIHTDTLNESGYVDDSIAAFKGRTIHTYHTEGAGGGHAPDIIRVCGEPNVLPSSTNPTRPFTVNTLDEHLDMLMVCHHLDREHPRGRGVRREPHPRRDDRRRGRPARPRRDQHDVERQPGDGPRRRGHHAHLADRAQDARASAAGWPASSGDNDNLRIRRYIAKYTINPAIAHGIGARGRLGRGRQARRPRALEAGVLRRQARAGAQGRLHRLGADGRCRTRRSRRRSRCRCGRCSARYGRATGATVARVRLAARRSTTGASRALRPAQARSSPCAAAAASASAT